MPLRDGYTDLPGGKVANVVTCLEMRTHPEPSPDPPRPECTLERITERETARYRTLFRRVGEQYLWFSRLALSDEQLAQTIRDPRAEIHAVRLAGRDEGLLELDFREPGECELLFFGITDALLGKGMGRWLMNRAIEMAWSRPIERFWLHTCTFDHPGALQFYIRSGFRPYKRQIEYSDDPRLTGLLPRNAAPQIPLL